MLIQDSHWTYSDDGYEYRVYAPSGYKSVNVAQVYEPELAYIMGYLPEIIDALYAVMNEPETLTDDAKSYYEYLSRHVREEYEYLSWKLGTGPGLRGVHSAMIPRSEQKEAE